MKLPSDIFLKPLTNKISELRELFALSIISAAPNNDTLCKNSDLATKNENPPIVVPIRETSNKNVQDWGFEKKSKSIVR